MAGSLSALATATAAVSDDVAAPEAEVAISDYREEAVEAAEREEARARESLDDGVARLASACIGEVAKVAVEEKGPESRAPLLEGEEAAVAVSVEGAAPTELTQKALNQMVCDRFMDLCGDMHVRKHALADGDTSVLERGFWYQNDYYFALKEHRFSKRKDWMVKQGSFFHGRPPNAMKLLRDDSATGIDMLHYVLKRGRTATDALDGIKSELCFIDYTIAYEIAYYDAIRAVWGDDKFNRYFSCDGGHPFILSPKLERTHLMPFIKQEGFAAGAGSYGHRHVMVGQRVCFMNFPDYQHKHINGEATNYNTICVDDTHGHQRYTGFGLPPEGVDEAAILEILAREYNRDVAYNFDIVTPKVATEIKRRVGFARLLLSERLAHRKITPSDILREGCL